MEENAPVERGCETPNYDQGGKWKEHKCMV